MGSHCAFSGLPPQHCSEIKKKEIFLDWDCLCPSSALSWCSSKHFLSLGLQSAGLEAAS